MNSFLLGGEGEGVTASVSTEVSAMVKTDPEELHPGRCSLCLHGSNINVKFLFENLSWLNSN